MVRDKLKEKIGEQRKVYEALKAGDASLVCYKEFQNGQWGTDDANYTNRLRLAYFLLYEKIDDEGAVAYLFQEELKDRENNSFQGIGSTLCILTWLLRKYNGGHKYDTLFQRAKDANFDCVCGYDVEDAVEEDFGKNDLLDCIFLCQEMEYKDVMGILVDAWKEGRGNPADWNPSDRRTLIGFNAFLDRNTENEALYQKQLNEILEEDSGNPRDMVAGYRDLIRFYLDEGDYGKGARYCHILLETTDYGQVRGIRLFGDILEECCEIVAHDPAGNQGLWTQIKEELQAQSQSAWYGNLYTKGIAAARAADDPYTEKLERAYRKWRKERGLSD